MKTTQVPVSKFKAECQKILRDVAKRGKQVEVTDHGKIVAVVTAPSQAKPSMKEFIGSLKGTVIYRPGWDAPLGAEDWEACR
ncbi:MAG: type II toxin-antitoxin system Phd/YefM family antitoxin [Verrucomicrobia bacterium]|nr:type II toxin-antitoxin system Phd/YefM family antitoxin [Verrucomicrobiota bacterium]